MNPVHKMHWFEKNEWREDDKAEVRRIVIDRWNTSYRGTEEATPAARTKSTPKSQWDLSLDSEDDECGGPRPLDTIESYLEKPRVPKSAVDEAGGLLKYWDNERRYRPRVAQMALDFLSAPAASVDAERVFSNGRLKLGHLQHQKSTDTFRAQMALTSWDGCPWFPGVAGLDKIIASHADREKKKAAEKAAAQAKSASKSHAVVDLSQDD